MLEPRISSRQRDHAVHGGSRICQRKRPDPAERGKLVYNENPPTGSMDRALGWVHKAERCLSIIIQEGPKVKNLNENNSAVSHEYMAATTRPYFWAMGGRLHPPIDATRMQLSKLKERIHERGWTDQCSLLMTPLQ